MSDFCPEGLGTCRDAGQDNCVVGRPCELHPTRPMSADHTADQGPRQDAGGSL